MTGCEDQILKKMQEERRCPACALVEDLEFEILSHLQYDVTKNENIRAAIAKAGGFCDFHFRRFRKLANSQTNALLLLALVREYCEHEDGMHTRCQVCEDTASYEIQLLEALNALLPRKDFRVLYEETPGVCLYHMRKLQRATQSIEHQLWLGQCQTTQMKNSMPLLQQLVDRSYFATTGDQRESIPRLIEKFVGRKGLGF